MVELLTVILIHSWYPGYCCSEIHCRPVPCDQVVEDRGGWFYIPTKERFARADVYPSQDKDCHVCTVNGRGLCAFIHPDT